jgi:cysteinyl-tRNA synthetase
VTLRLFDTRAAGLREFRPVNAPKVGIYVCGPTVQSSPHIGHLRSALVYDQWRRWLTYRGYDVTLVRNVTDIDDKILINSAAEQAGGSTEEWWALAYRYELEFTASYLALGIDPPSYEPRATGNIPQMQGLIARLIEREHAYPASDGSGDVYFDVSSWPAYGELTRQSIEDMAADTGAEVRGKRDPRDFALWKGRKSDEPESASWASPWGPGRPGWHIECSAMSAHYLGRHFDIHGGGLDLRFPHHENELAQSSAAGERFAEYWVHNGLVTVDGDKMSKSLGNSIYASDLLAKAPAIVIRYYLGSAHYRSTIDFHDGALTEARAALERIAGFLERAGRLIGGSPHMMSGAEIPAEFASAMDDDLAVPRALGVLHDVVRRGNAALDNDQPDAALVARAEVVAMTQVLGIDPASAHWKKSEGTTGHALAALVERMLAARQEARARRDWARADTIRDDLIEAGIAIEDTPAGAQWSVAS